MNFQKPMLNSVSQNNSEVGTEFLQRVLTRLQASCESRQLANKTSHVENIPSTLDSLLDWFQRNKR